MRRTPGVVVVAPGVFAGTNSQKAIAAVPVGEGVAAAGEIWVQRRVVLVARMQVTPGGIGLPYFDHSVRHRPPILIQHPPAYRNSFAQRFTTMLASEVAGLRIHSLRREYRTRDLRKRVRQIDERLRGRSLQRRSIWWMQMRRLHPGKGAAVRRHAAGLLLHAGPCVLRSRLSPGHVARNLCGEETPCQADYRKHVRISPPVV